MAESREKSDRGLCAKVIGHLSSYTFLCAFPEGHDGFCQILFTRPKSETKDAWEAGRRDALEEAAQLIESSIKPAILVQNAGFASPKQIAAAIRALET